MGKASTRAQNRYIAKAYDRINLTVPKGKKEVLQAHAEAQGESVNDFIGRAISEAMARDGGTAPETAGKRPESTQGVGAVSLPPEALKTAREGAETGKQPAPVDREKAWENILETFSDVSMVDLDKARRERLGIVYLPPDTLESAQQAAERTGETVQGLSGPFCRPAL